MKGHLDLIAGADAAGRTFLRSQRFRAPMHLSKPYFDGETLLVNVVNPTAGLFSGDSVKCVVEVESGARVLLASPSASRVHRATDGVAALEQSFAVRAGGFLEVLPELFIPQAGARYRQVTRVEVEDGAELVLFELIAPGRVASGEAFEFESLDWETDLRWNGRAVLRERFSLAPGGLAVAALRRRFAVGYYGSAIVSGIELRDDVARALAQLQNDRLWVGASRLSAGGWTVRMLAETGPELRRAVAETRSLVYRTIDRTPPSLRRA